MSQLSRPSSIFRFGPFELNPASAELRNGGVRIKLYEQPYRILVELLTRPGEVVTRDELCRALWPDDTFVDFDHSLNSAVNRLRETLADSASKPRFIETVPRRGYRFIGTVERIEPPVAPVPENLTEQPADPPDRTVTRPSWQWGLVASLLALILVLGGWALNSRTSASPKVFADTSYPGYEILPSLSPDGRQVAFAWNGGNEDNYDIYVKQVGMEGTLRLTDGPNIETEPQWSPDGSMIAFLRVRLPDNLDVILKSPLGGPEKTVGTIREPGMDGGPKRLGDANTHMRRRMSWMPEGEWLVIEDTPTEQGQSALFLLSVRSGEKRQLTFPARGSGGDRTPTVSPDGRTIAFMRGLNTLNSRVHLLKLNGELVPTGTPEPLRTITKALGDLGWTADSRELIFATGAVHNGELWRVRVSGSDPARWIDRAGSLSRLFAVRGSRLVYSQFVFDVNIWKVETELRDGKPAKPVRVIASTYVDHVPEFSPNGKHIAFISTRTGSQEIWMADASGSNPLRLTFMNPREVFSVRWSVDSEQIVFHADGGDKAQLHRVNRHGRTEKLAENSGLITPSLSRDGRFIYFTRASDFQVFKAPVDKLNDRASWNPMSTGGGRWPSESPDGKFLYYVRDNALWAMPVSGGAGKLLLPSLSNPANYAVVEHGIYFIPAPGGADSHQIQFLEFSSGAIRLVHTLERPAMWGMTASPDGRSVLFAQVDHAGSNLMVMDNFR